MLVVIEFRIIALLCDIEEHKVKAKSTLDQAIKAHRGSRDIALLFL